MIDATDTDGAIRENVLNNSDGKLSRQLAHELDNDFCPDSSSLTGNHGKQDNDRFSTAFLASVIASLGSLNFGYTLGYTSPTELEIESDTRIHVSKTQFSWFAVSIVFY